MSVAALYRDARKYPLQVRWRSGTKRHSTAFFAGKKSSSLAFGIRSDLYKILSRLLLYRRIWRHREGAPGEMPANVFIEAPDSDVVFCVLGGGQRSGETILTQILKELRLWRCGKLGRETLTRTKDRIANRQKRKLGTVSSRQAFKLWVFLPA